MSNIFITGATGVVGRGVVPLLVADGHTVRGVARSLAKAELLRALGAEPVAVDLLDAAAVSSAVAGSDAIVHLATRIPPLAKMRSASAWRENDRLRSETTRHLVDAALDHGIPRVVAASVTFSYVDCGDTWIDEDTETDPGGLLDSALDLEREIGRVTAAGGAGVVLRFGLFYGPTARSTDEHLGLARRGLAVTTGDPTGYISSVHTDDAASAVVAGLDVPAGTYNAVDDEPLTRRDFNDALTSAFGMPRVRFLPTGTARVVAGKGAGVMARSQRVSNRRLREATGWAPQHADARQGWQGVAAGRAPTASAGPGVQAALLVLAFTGLAIGAWAAFAPRGFFDSFPGLGQTWVAVDGPYNEHLVRDFGALNLALGVVAAAALVSLVRPLVAAAAGAWLAYGVPHVVYHSRHTASLDGPDAIALLSALTFTAALALVVLLLSAGRSRIRSDPVQTVPRQIS